MRFQAWLLAAVAALLPAMPLHVSAQATYKAPAVTKSDYVKPFPPVRIAANLYYVGTYDLGVYLITTSAGSILINTGINDSVPAIRSNIEKLGFKLSDIKLLLATHGHWDHGAVAPAVVRGKPPRCRSRARPSNANARRPPATAIHRARAAYRCRHHHRLA